MITHRESQRRTAGFSLIELLVSIGVLGLILTAVGLVQLRSAAESKSMQARGIAEARARRALDRVAEELTGVGHSFMFPDPSGSTGTSALTYQRPTGVNNLGVVTWGIPSRLQLQLEPRELDNGVDDDSDGLVDERQLVYTRDFGAASATMVVLCTGIPELAPGEIANNIVDDNGNGVADEAGFNVQRIGDLLTIRITVQQPFAGNQIATVSLETSIVLHNN
jgi:prepilin-type N-terminal cleavage/methylation domain-containing protein